MPTRQGEQGGRETRVPALVAEVLWLVGVIVYLDGCEYFDQA